MVLNRQSGATIIELAIALPVFLAIILGIVQYGWLLNNYVILNNAALTGVALLASERGYATPHTDTITLVQNTVANFSGSTMNSTLTITLAIGVSPNLTTCTSDSACATALGTLNASLSPPTSNPPAPGLTAEVAIAYTYTPLVQMPLIPSPLQNCTGSYGSQTCQLNSITASQFVQ